MQPTAVMTSPAEGLIYINGRLAGETGPDSPLILPVTPSGTLYIQFSPFGRRYRAGTYRLRMAGGEPKPESADDAYQIVIWPGNIIEISLTPFAAYPPESEYGMIDGLPAAILRGEASLLRIGQSSIALPDGAKLPNRRISSGGAELFMGKAGTQQYLAAYVSGSLSPSGAIVADSISIDGSRVSALTQLNDTAWHIRKDSYAISDGIPELIESEILRDPNTSQRPTDAENTALALTEALMLGLETEADEYLSGSLSATDCAQYIKGASTAVPMKYYLPGAVPAIGLVNRSAANIAMVQPLYYRAHREPDGRWLLTSLSE